MNYIFKHFLDNLTLQKTKKPRTIIKKIERGYYIK